MAPWWIKYQSEDDMGGASQDVRYRKPKAVEAALSREPCLPDASDVGNEFLLGSKVTLSEHHPSAANINTEDEENDLSAESEDVSNEKSKRFNQYMKNFLLN